MIVFFLSIHKKLATLSDSNCIPEYMLMLKQYTTISYLSGRQSKLSAPRSCGHMMNYCPRLKASGNSSLGGPQHLGADSFDCRPERYNIDVLLPNSHFKGNVFF